MVYYIRKGIGLIYGYINVVIFKFFFVLGDYIYCICLPKKYALDRYQARLCGNFNYNLEQNIVGITSSIVFYVMFYS